MIFKRYGLIAHRGLHDRARGVPENSLPAFECAVAGGYAIELDIHLTKDGQAVVFHDDTLMRMTGKSGCPDLCGLTRPTADRTEKQGISRRFGTDVHSAYTRLSRSVYRGVIQPAYDLVAAPACAPDYPRTACLHGI